ncbi:TSUP family transporter [Georgenia sp. Z1491]|uniref:TSUP family transporter n=1 Tax=Georgenia sp. Z1491 TaxID=3416707 RepID=UPI003CF5099A
MSLGEILVAVTAVAVGTTLQRVSGMGVGLVVAPVLSLLIGPVAGVWLTNATTTVSAFVIWRAMRTGSDWRRLRTLLPCAVIGAVPAALVVRELPLAWLEITVGSILVLGLLGTVLASAADRLPPVRGPFAAGVAGAVGGFFNTTAGVAGPSLVMYSRLSRWPHPSFAASMQPTFLTMGVLSVVLKLGVGAAPVSDLPQWWVVALLAGTVVAVVPLAGRLAARVPAETARRLALTVAWAGAIATLLRGASRLL